MDSTGRNLSRVDVEEHEHFRKVRSAFRTYMQDTKERLHWQWRLTLARPRPLASRRKAILGGFCAFAVLIVMKTLLLAPQTKSTSIQPLRIEQIANFCASHPQTVPYGEPLIASPDHLLLYCHVPKTASTAWMQVLALVAGEDQQLISDMLAKDQLHKFMLDHRSLSVQDVNAKLDAKQERFLFTRHPFTRVASAFTDKFVRRREKSFYIPLLKFKRRNKLRKKDQDPMQNNKQQQISFEDFVDFVMHEINKGSVSYGTLHWLPSTRLCDICHSNFTFVGKLETLETDIAELSKRNPQIVQHLDVFNTKWNANVNNTADETARKLFQLLPHSKIEALSETFKDDFEAFGYNAVGFFDHVHS